MCEPRRTRRQRPVAAQPGDGRDKYHPYPTMPANQDADKSKVTQAETDSTAEIDSTSTIPQPCRLMELPAELRNEIYELAFTRATPGEEPIDLLAAKPPSYALLQTCRQIYNEAKQLFPGAVRQYYSDEHFFCDLSRTETPRAELCKVAQRFDLQNMRNLRVTFRDRFSTVYDPEPQPDSRSSTVYDLEPQPDRKSLSVVRRHPDYPDLFCGFRVCMREHEWDPVALHYAGYTEEERVHRLQALGSFPRDRIVVRVADQLDVVIANEHTIGRSRPRRVCRRGAPWTSRRPTHYMDLP